jgi:hypothetical protein
MIASRNESYMTIGSNPNGGLTERTDPMRTVFERTPRRPDKFRLVFTLDPG